MWVSDGVANNRWVPVSPVTGEIVPCEWKVPYDMLPTGAEVPFVTGSGATAVLTAPATSKSADSTATAPPADDPGVGDGEAA